MDSQLLHYLDLLAEGRADEAEPSLLQELRRRYPYFSKPDSDLVTSLNPAGLTPDELNSLKASIMMTTGNPDAVSSALGLKSDADFYSESQPLREKMTTESTIDSFLERYGNPADNDKEMALLEKLIFNPVAPDYTASLEALQPAAAQTTAPQTAPGISSRQDQLIDAFIAKNADDISTSADDSSRPMPIASISSDKTPATPTPAPMTSHTAMPSTEPGNEARQHALLTESLAKIYIKKGRYAKAFEIIHSLSLNYPEKSCYFADQLRFLHKLMLIQELQQKDKK